MFTKTEFILKRFSVHKEKPSLPEYQTTLVLRRCHKGVHLSSYMFMVQVITMQPMIVYISSSYEAIHARLLRTFTWSDSIGQNTSCSIDTVHNIHLILGDDIAHAYFRTLC